MLRLPAGRRWAGLTDVI